ncbi:flagellar export chaperone FliS [Nocardioides sp. TF02-7]|uniref:flagellar export chaperone FliS n=1 Tax=Nocardioides sp. TF02-7 TaxID=2917724 RepID=UPI001F056650|nr:flagellar export chaperone FliS [Nocardioides sp. TF02-7]UMG92950.1 flagellar protein FliS [Nocardioides sp. TF02-7]
MHLKDARSAYLGNAVTTASPARLLVMLVERLALDVERGLEAQQASDWTAAHRHLIHAQDVVVELATSLAPDEMPRRGGAGDALRVPAGSPRRGQRPARPRGHPRGARAGAGARRDLADRGAVERHLLPPS